MQKMINQTNNYKCAVFYTKESQCNNINLKTKRYEITFCYVCFDKIKFCFCCNTFCTIVLHQNTDCFKETTAYSFLLYYIQIV